MNSHVAPIAEHNLVPIVVERVVTHRTRRVVVLQTRLSCRLDDRSLHDKPNRQTVSSTARGGADESERGDVRGRSTPDGPFRARSGAPPGSKHEEDYSDRIEEGLEEKAMNASEGTGRMSSCSLGPDRLVDRAGR